MGKSWYGNEIQKAGTAPNSASNGFTIPKKIDNLLYVLMQLKQDEKMWN